MSEIIVGASDLPEANIGSMREAGIGWLRHGFPYPFVDRPGGERSARYLEARAQAVKRAAQDLGHTETAQGDSVRIAHEVSLEKRTILLGAFFYRWEDQTACWQCGRPDCHVETAWGLVERAGQPKPAYQAFQQGVRRLQMEG